MKLFNLILISMVFVSNQSCMAVTADENLTSSEQSRKMLLADLSTDEIKKLKDSGEIMSLESILQQVQKDFKGRIIEIELEEDNNAYIYEIELVDKDNVVWELEIDATTGNVIKHEQDD